MSVADPTAVVAPATAAPGRAFRVPRRASLAVGLLLVLGPVVASLVARIWVGRDGLEIFAAEPSLAPSRDHLLGTDGSGRDIVALLAYGTPPTFELALIVGVVATVIGTVAGIVSGYVRGVADTAVRGATDVMLGIPPLALMIVIGALIGSLSLRGLALAIGLLTWPLTARAIRSQVLALREQPFVLMSRLSNRNSASIMFLELLPNVLALVIASLIGVISGGLAVAVGLQLLGIGPTDVPSLGLVLQEAITLGSFSQGLWWWWAPPAAVLVTLFIGLFLTSLAVDEIANPRLKGTRTHG